MLARTESEIKDILEETVLGAKDLEGHVVAIIGTLNTFGKQATLAAWLKKHGAEVGTPVSGCATHVAKGNIEKANKIKPSVVFAPRLG